MQLHETVFTKTEDAVNKLRKLYKQYGYKRYKMSKFETYDFYLQNRDFLLSEHVITFTDMRGKLMALKPDVTLSIVKNAAGEDGRLQKYFYNEHVFRMMDNTHEFREITQVGLEYIGDIDLFATCEVLMLAKRSLEQIAENSLLEISHMGLVSGILQGTALSAAAQKEIIRCMGQKNVHEIRAICAQEQIGEEACCLLEKLATLYGSFAKVLPAVKEMVINEYTAQAVQELETVYQVLSSMGLAEQINLDFSIANDMHYYNGIIFQGYVEGVPMSILSGGRYDRLLHKFGTDKNLGAIGFAVYADLLENYSPSQKQYDVDALVLYDEDTMVADLLKQIQMLIEQGITVRVQKQTEPRVLARQVLRFTEKGLERIG